jgi:sigma-B regulation protein RsbU (phosphoserine phosphatase)
LVSDPGAGLCLQSRGPVIGVMPGLKYPSVRIKIPSPADLYLFSDGVYEIARSDGSWQSWEEFSRLLEKDRPPVETIVSRMREMHGVEEFEDDFSLLKVSLA